MRFIEAHSPPLPSWVDPTAEDPVRPLPSHRIRELSGARPAAVQALLTLGLDAASDATLAQACEAAGLSVLDTLRALEGSVPEWSPRNMEAWSDAPLREVVDHLLDRHHAYARSEVKRLGALLEACMTRLGAEAPSEWVKVHGHFRHFRTDLEGHLDQEEQSIFPALLEDGVPETGGWERQLTLEHAAVEELFQNIGTLLRHYEVPEGADPAFRSLILGLRDLEEDLHVHIFLENEVLFPRCAGTGTATASPAG